MTQASAAPTVFVVDDDPSVLKALSRVLREEGFGVETFESAEAFLARPDHNARGCVVLDVSMPGLDGLELQQRLVAEGDSLPIVFISGHGDIPTSVRAIKAGATDFLTKPVEARALVASVRAAIDEQELQRKTLADTAGLRQRLASLTLRERDVLAGLAAGKLNKQIASDLGVVEQTVKFHRARIMDRMQVRTSAELMTIAGRLGIGSPTTRSDGAAPLQAATPSAGKPARRPQP